MNTRNRHKVPIKAWKRWNSRERHVFNETYRNMLDERAVLGTLAMHNELAEVPNRSLRVFAFNVAWIAADAAREVRA